MAKPSYLQVSYPNFVVNQTADPDQIDQNNADITNKVNETLDYIDEVANGFTSGAVPDGSITQAKLAFNVADVKVTNAVNADTIANQDLNALNARYISAKNVLINSNFNIWQRNTSFNLSGTSVAQYTADRWLQHVNSGVGGTANTVVVSRQAFAIGQTDVPNEPQYFLRSNLTVPGNLGTSGTYISLSQRIESVRTLAGKTVSLSFYAKADVPRSVGICVSQIFGTGGAPSVNVDVYGTILNLTTAWQRFRISFAVPSIVGKTLGTNNDDYLRLAFIYYKQDNSSYPLPAGLVGNLSAGYLDLAQIQLYAGDYDLPYVPLSFAEELRLCQRYFEKSFDMGVFAGTASAPGALSSCFNVNGAFYSQPRYSVRKRIKPTVKTYSTSTGAVDTVRNETTNADVAVNYGSPANGETSMFVFITAGFTSGNVGSYQWTSEAEL